MKFPTLMNRKNNERNFRHVDNSRLKISVSKSVHQVSEWRNIPLYTIFVNVSISLVYLPHWHQNIPRSVSKEMWWLCRTSFRHRCSKKASWPLAKHWWVRRWLVSLASSGWGHEDWPSPSLSSTWSHLTPFYQHVSVELSIISMCIDLRRVVVTKLWKNSRPAGMFCWRADSCCADAWPLACDCAMYEMTH